MVQDNPPQEGQVRVNLAVQVAGIAAQVTSALRSESAEKRQELEETLARARALLLTGPAPEGLVPFIDVMCGVLRGEDMSVDALALPASFRAVYDQLVQETSQDKDEGELTLREVLEEIVHNVIVAMRQGTHAQRRMMANTLQRMQQESARRPDLRSLIIFLDAARALLLDEDWSPAASQLGGAFQLRWEEILDGLRE